MALDVAIVRNPSSVSAGQIVHSGNSLGSSFPTMASVNSDYSEWNQALALYNRRTNQLMATPDTVSYWSNGIIVASALNALRTKIATLRSLAGQSVFSWTNTISSGSKIRTTDLSDIFSALNWSSVKTINPFSNHIYVRTDHPFGTFSSASDSVNTGNLSGGTNGGAGSSGTNLRFREGISYAPPTGFASLATPSTCAMSVTLTSTTSGSAGGTCAMTAYASSTDDSAFTGSWWTNNNSVILSHTFTSSASSVSIPIAWTDLTAQAHYSTLWSSVNEWANTFENRGISGFAPSISLDWGF